MTQTFQKIWINKHLDSSSQFNPQPKTTTGLTGRTRVPGLVSLSVYCIRGKITVTISGWDTIWDIGEDYSNNKHCKSI